MCASVASSLEASNQEEFVGPFETSWSYELENKGHGFYTKVNADSAPSGLGGCAFVEDDNHEAYCANVHNANEFAQHWAEDCDSFSYEGLKPKNFMEESPFVERGQCHRVGSGRPHRDSKEDGHHEDC
jgi:hypothetical protein